MLAASLISPAIPFVQAGHGKTGNRFMPARLLNELHARLSLGATRAITFDIFDTFLLRRCVSPQGVFERAAFLAPIATVRPGLVDSYVQHRRLAESKAHRDAKSNAGSPEIPITQIYERFPVRLFGLERSVTPQLIDAEFAAELDLCFVNPDIFALYEEARRFGLRVGFVSDTYWSADRIGKLLRTAAPDLAWDFLYASCDHGTGKAENLFGRLLAEQGLSGSEVLHLGDNPMADIKGAQKSGIETIHVPQASIRLAAILQREDTAIRVLGNGGADKRQDGGLSALRRIIAAREHSGRKAFQLGLEVVGPLMAAFDRFIADRVAAIAGSAGNVAIAFLARDGMLSFDIWQASRRDPALYLEINRRVALIAAATTLTPLTKLFSHFPALDRRTVSAMLKIQTPRLDAFFLQCSGGRCTGEEFADAMPDLFDAGEIRALADETRHDLLAYLRSAIPNLDTITDLVLVDIGYAGSIQQSLRQVFDVEGIPARLHGLYLLSFDDAFVDFAGADSAEGFISDLVLPPRVKRVVARNATVIEHACCAPQGSVLGYKNGKVLYEADPRPADQLAMCTDIQAGALTFAAQARTLAAAGRVDPFTDLELAASRSAATLARLLLLPTDEELVLLGGMKHDVNWGTQTLAPMIDPMAADRYHVALALPTFCAMPEPPMWLAGTMTSLSPAQGFLYALFSAGHLAGDIFADAKCGSIDVKAIAAGATRSFAVSWFRTSNGDIRIHIPVPRSFGTLALAVPFGHVAPEGVLAGITIQNGDTVAEAMQDRDVKHLKPGAWTASGVEFFGDHYRVDSVQEHQLLLQVPVLSREIGLITILIRLHAAVDRPQCLIGRPLAV
jgi:FMN phosphatase YigB (HAD superfamily)